MNRTTSRVAAKAVVAVLAALMFLPAAVASAKPAPTTATPIGYDVSWPQCGKALPTTHAFGIVGVNDGMANNTNSCLAAQLSWAQRARGGTTQARMQLYVNTGNPGGLGTASWPTSNVDPAGLVAPNPHGTCAGSDSVACAWMYGWNRALEDIRDRFLPAATQAKVNTDPTTYPWWLDVELANSWKTGGTPSDHASNAAVLRGMVDHFHGRGITVGVYSTGYQWDLIVGPRAADFAGLDSWLAGARNLSEAKSMCAGAPLNPGGRVVLTQFVAKNLDNDHSCLG